MDRSHGYGKPTPIEQIEQLRQRVAELESQLRVKEATVGKMANDAQNLTAERDALKQAYESAEESVLALKETRNRLAEERDKAAKYWQIAEGRCDALKQQRDELLKVLEPFVKYNSSKSVIDLAIRTSDITKARAAIASVKER